MFFFSADKPVSSGILKMLRVMMWSFSRGPGNPRETGGDWKFGTRVSDVGQQDFHDDSPDFGYVDVWYGIYVCNVFIYIYIYLLYDVHWRSVYRYITQCVYNCDVAYFFWGRCTCVWLPMSFYSALHCCSDSEVCQSKWRFVYWTVPLVDRLERESPAGKSCGKTVPGRMGYVAKRPPRLPCKVRANFKGTFATSCAAAILKAQLNSISNRTGNNPWKSMATQILVKELNL